MELKKRYSVKTRDGKDGISLSICHEPLESNCKESFDETIFKTLFFEHESKQFQNADVGISGRYIFDSKSSTLKLYLQARKGDVLYIYASDSTLYVVKKARYDLDGPSWLKDSDVVNVPCDSLYTLNITLDSQAANDFALDYGYYIAYGGCTFMQLMSGDHWRFLDRVTGG